MTRPISVLMALTPPDGSTRYVDQVVAELPPEVSITYRTWKSAFTGRYDVFHIHWPELLVRAKNPVTSAGRGLALLILLGRLRLGRVAIVRTLHNLDAVGARRLFPADDPVHQDQSHHRDRNLRAGGHRAARALSRLFCWPAATGSATASIVVLRIDQGLQGH